MNLFIYLFFNLIGVIKLKLEKILEICSPSVTILLMPDCGEMYIEGSISSFKDDTFNIVLAKLQKYKVVSIGVNNDILICRLDIIDDLTFIDKLCRICEKEFICLNVCDRVSYGNIHKDKPHRYLKVYECSDDK